MRYAAIVELSQHDGMALLPMREINIEELLAREPIELDRAAVRSLIDADPSSSGALATLKAQIEQRLAPDRVIKLRAACGVSGDFDTSYLQAFAAGAESKLRQSIDHYIAKIEASELRPSPGPISRIEVTCFGGMCV